MLPHEEASARRCGAVGQPHAMIISMPCAIQYVEGILCNTICAMVYLTMVNYGNYKMGASLNK